MKSIQLYIWGAALLAVLAIVGTSAYSFGNDHGKVESAGLLTTCTADKVTIQEAARKADAKAREEVTAEFSSQIKERDGRLILAAKLMDEYSSQNATLSAQLHAKEVRLQNLSEHSKDAKVLLDTNITSLRMQPGETRSSTPHDTNSVQREVASNSREFRASLLESNAGSSSSEYFAFSLSGVGDGREQPNRLRGSGDEALAVH